MYIYIMPHFLTKNDIWEALPVSNEVKQAMLKEFIENDSYDKIRNAEDDMIIVTKDKNDEDKKNVNDEKK
jgi:hypothetical protein